MQGRYGALLTTSNDSLAWQGGTGDLLDAANWNTVSGAPAIPEPGDNLTLRTGTATFSATEAATRTLEAMRITLASATPAVPVVLQASDASFGADTTVRNGRSSGGVLQALGSTVFNGTMMATARNGTITLSIGSDAAGLPGNFLVGASSGQLVATQKGSLDITGQGVLDNQGIILAAGSVNIGPGISVIGDSGQIQIQTGGSVTIGNSLDQNVFFTDNTGRLTLAQLSGFQESYSGIFGFQQGNAIDLPGLAADGFGYDASSSILTLTQNGQPVGSFFVQTDDNQANFVLAPDGSGGSLVTYRQPNPLLQPGLPVAVVAAPGQAVSLRSIITAAFGAVPANYASYGLSSLSQQVMTTYNWSYWDPATPSVSAWTVNGVPVAPLSGAPPVPPFSAMQTVTAAGIDGVSFVAGNNIGPETFLQVPVAGNGALTTQNVYYSILTIDPAVASPTMGSGRVDPADMVASALRFAAYYPAPPNDNDCGFIASALGAAAGATMSFQVLSTDPAANVSAGFWRIVYRASDHANPVRDWSTLVQPGDVVRMGWDGGGQHTTTIVARNADGSVTVYDNDAEAPDADTSSIGLHRATYWEETRPDSITIYRLDPLHQYLVTGSPQAAIMQGSAYNNLFQPGGGADTITGGSGNNAVEASLTQLDGVAITDFHMGDTLDVTGLASTSASVRYDTASGRLTVSGASSSATLQLPSGFAGQPFFVAPDGRGGTAVGLAPVDLSRYPDVARSLLLALFTPLAAAGRTASVLTVTDGSALPAPVFGEANYAFLASPAPGAAVAVPAGYAGLFAGGTAAVSLSDAGSGGILLVGNAGRDTLRGAAGDVVVSGGGDTLMTAGPGGVLVGGAGHDTILGGGIGSILMGGTGGSLIGDTAGRSAVIAGTGADTVFAGVADTIAAGSAGVLVAMASGAVFLNGTASSTVLGGGGTAETIYGAAGGGLFGAGTGGNNLVLAGTGAATVFGGGNGDVLFAGGAAAQVIVAGTGNETLSGAGSTGDNVFFGGSGTNVIGAGAGRETFVAGSGGGTLISGTGADVFAFANGFSSGGVNQVTGFDPSKGDRVLLSGYGPDAVRSALATATTQDGSTTLRLPDQTVITFTGMANLQASSFV